MKVKVLGSFAMLCILTGCSQQATTKSTEPIVQTSSVQTSSNTVVESTEQTTASEEAVPYPAGSLLKAVEAKDLTLVQSIIKDETYDLDERNKQGESPLLIATHQNEVAIAQALILAGADVNLQDHIQDSPYLYAGAEGRTEILKVMLAHSHPDQHVYNRYGGNALIPAAEKGHLDNVKLLLADGSVDINHQNNPGYTALIEAVALRDGSKVYVEIVRELLQNGADPSLRDKFGKTAKDYAKELGYQEILNEIQKVE